MLGSGHPRIHSACFYSSNKERNVELQHYQVPLWFFFKEKGISSKSQEQKIPIALLILLFNLLWIRREQKEAKPQNEYFWFGWENGVVDREWKKASEIIRNELFKWNISILCSTKRLTAVFASLCAMIIYHRHHFDVDVCIFSQLFQRKFDGFYQPSDGMSNLISHNCVCPRYFHYDSVMIVCYFNSRRPCVFERIDIVKCFEHCRQMF